MEPSSTSILITKSIEQISELLSSSHKLIDVLHQFNEILKLKSSKNLTKEYHELRLKSEKKKRKEQTIKDKFTEMQEYSRKELEFKSNIVLQNCFLIIQQQQKHCELMTKEKLIHQHKIHLNEKKLKISKEKLLEQIDSAENQFKNLRNENMLYEKTKRTEWLKIKKKLSDTLLRYDTEMMEQQNELEFIQTLTLDEEKELQYYKTTCSSQEIIYKELIKEKEDYEEAVRQNKLFEIRLKFAKRTIVKFIEQHYPAWKKRKLRASKKKSKYRFNIKPK